MLPYVVKMEFIIIGLLFCVTSSFSQSANTFITSPLTTSPTTTLSTTSTSTVSPVIASPTTTLSTTSTYTVSPVIASPTTTLSTTTSTSTVSPVIASPTTTLSTTTNRSTTPEAKTNPTEQTSETGTTKTKATESTTTAKMSVSSQSTLLYTTDNTTGATTMHSSSESNTATVDHLSPLSTFPHPSTSTDRHPNRELDPGSLMYPQESLDRSRGYFTIYLTLQENSNVTRNRTLTPFDKEKIVHTLFSCSEETNLAVNCYVELVEAVKMSNPKGFNTTFRIRLDGLQERNLTLKALSETITNGTYLSISNLNLTIGRESIVTSFEKYLRGRDECDAVGVRCPRGYQCHVLSSDHYTGSCVHLCDLQNPCGEHGVCFYDTLDTKKTSCRCRSTSLTLYYGDTCTEQTGKFEYVLGFSLGAAALVVVMVTIVAVLCRRRSNDGSTSFTYKEKSVARADFLSESGGVEVTDIKHRKSTKFGPHIAVYKEGVGEIKEDDLQTLMTTTVSDVTRTVDPGDDSATVTNNQSDGHSTGSREFSSPQTGNASNQSVASNSKPTERNPTSTTPNQPQETSSKTHREKIEPREKIPLSSAKPGLENRTIEKRTSFLFGST